jgi:hypothetical protein
MDKIAADLEAACVAAESSSLDPLMTVRSLVASVRKAVADHSKPEPEETTGRRRKRGDD